MWQRKYWAPASRYSWLIAACGVSQSEVNSRYRGTRVSAALVFAASHSSGQRYGSACLLLGRSSRTQGRGPPPGAGRMPSPAAVAVAPAAAVVTLGAAGPGLAGPAVTVVRR